MTFIRQRPKENIFDVSINWLNVNTENNGKRNIRKVAFNKKRSNVKFGWKKKFTKFITEKLLKFILEGLIDIRIVTIIFYTKNH